MKTGQFYNFPTRGGNKMVNINNIACIEDHPPNGILVTLNVSNEKGINISFTSQLSWADTTGQIIFQDREQHEQ